MLMDRVRGPVELRYYNPLRAKVGSSVMINQVEWKEHNFFVKELREYRRVIGGQEFRFVDYVLLSRPLGGEDLWLRLRLVPLEGADATRVSGLDHDVLLLQLYDELAYSEDFYKVVTDTTRKFEVREDGRVTEEYWRVGDVTDSYKAQVSVIKDMDNDGKVDSDEVEAVRLEYWDYVREVKDEAGQPQRQYLIVEMDAGSGWFQLWRGQETDAQQVFVM
jgi:hypothetical protein